jgi:hypothetical protein
MLNILRISTDSKLITQYVINDYCKQACTIALPNSINNIVSDYVLSHSADNLDTELLFKLALSCSVSQNTEYLLCDRTADGFLSHYKASIPDPYVTIDITYKNDVVTTHISLLSVLYVNNDNYLVTVSKLLPMPCKGVTITPNKRYVHSAMMSLLQGL